MHRVLTSLLSAAALAAAFLAAPAYAQRADMGSGFYLGAALGASNTSVDNGPVAGFATTGTDESDFAWNLNAGYKFTRNIAVEVGYVDLGTFGASGRFGGTPTSVSADVTGWNISGVFTLPLNDLFSLYGKLGYFRSETKASASVGGALARSTSRQNDITAGIGARYHFNRNVSLLIEANHYELGDNGNAQSYLVGARYDF